MTAKMARMQEELNSKDAQLRVKLSAHELQLKEQIVYNVRQKADEIVSLRGPGGERQGERLGQQQLCSGREWV
jgi:hypothetical protein